MFRNAGHLVGGESEGRAGDATGEGGNGSSESDVLHIGVVEENEEAQFAVREIFDVVRVGARDEIHIAGLEFVGFGGTAGALDGHARATGVNESQLGSLRMPVRFAHADALESQRIHREMFERGPGILPCDDSRTDRRGDQRRTGLDGELQRVGIRGLFGNHRGSVGASDLDVDRRAGDAGNLSDREAPGVAEHGGIEATGESRDAEILGHFMREGDEKLGRLVAEIFDRMERAAGREKHFALGDGELRMLVAAGENGDKCFPFQAVAEFVGVCVPMGLAEASGIQGQAVDREPFEDGEVRFIDGGFDATFVRNLGPGVAERGFVRHIGLRLNKRCI